MFGSNGSRIFFEIKQTNSPTIFPVFLQIQCDVAGEGAPVRVQEYYSMKSITAFVVLGTKYNEVRQQTAK